MRKTERSLVNQTQKKNTECTAGAHSAAAGFTARTAEPESEAADRRNKTSRTAESEATDRRNNTSRTAEPEAADRRNNTSRTAEPEAKTADRRNSTSRSAAWTAKSYCRKGVRHRENGLKCQDSVFSAKSGSVCAAALADGSGSTDLAALGSKAAAKTAAKLFAEHFEELYRMTEAELKYNLLIQIREELYRICREYHTGIEEVKSTLLVFAVNSADGRFVLAHLGDGGIGIQNGDRKQIVSWPVNGISRSYTVLTSTVPAADSLQVRRGTLDEKISAVYLFSDGWGEDARSCEQQLVCAAGRLDQRKKKENYLDDIGVIALMRQEKQD